MYMYMYLCDDDMHSQEVTAAAGSLYSNIERVVVGLNLKS